MKRTIVIAAAALAAALPATAHAGQYFQGFMGPGGSAVSGTFTSWTASGISGTYVAGRTYRVGYAIACCGGSSYYSGSTFLYDSNILWTPDASSAKGYCERSTLGSGQSTITCTTY